ncbi:hypothetical protein KUCAC02_004493, partial [Chaenocephalus aceratus]
EQESRVTILLSVNLLLQDDEQALVERPNEDGRMVVGGNFIVGARCARRRRETQQGGIQVAALSTSREIPTQAMLFFSHIANWLPSKTWTLWS